MAGALGPIAATAGRTLVRAAPAISTKAMDFIKRTTQGRVSTLTQAASLAARDENGLAIVTEGLVRAGIAPSRIFTDDAIRSMEAGMLQRLRGRMDKVFNDIMSPVDAASTFKPTSDADRDILALEVLNVVGRLFRTTDGPTLKRIHVNLKLFGAMDEAQLDQALALRTVALRSARFS